MAAVQGQPAMDWDLQDELYMQRRHAVAMEGLEEELEEGEIPPLVDENFNEEEFINELNAILPQLEDNQHGNNPFEEGADFIQLPPELERNVEEEEWGEIQGPLERQNGVDPFQEAEEEDERRREEWLHHNYLIAMDPNSRWEAINHNHLWHEDPERANINWQFPSADMKKVDKDSVVLGHLFKVHRDNRRLLDPRREIPTQFRNRFLGIYLRCAECRCCERHMRDRPEFGEIVQDAPIDFRLRLLHLGEKENNCICPCRHIMRSHNRLMHNH